MASAFSLPPPQEEPPFCVDGVPLLTFSWQLPQLPGKGQLNRYYRSCRDAFFRTCRREVFPLAQEEYRLALEGKAPLPQWQARLTTTVTFNGGTMLSLHTDAVIRGMAQRYVLRRGDTWDIRRQLPIPMRTFFPPRTALRRILCDTAAQQIAREEEVGLSRYHPHWQQLLRRSFHPHRFFLSGEGLHFFYPLYAIAPAAEGIPTFCLPYDQEKGPFTPAEA